MGCEANSPISCDSYAENNAKICYLGIGNDECQISWVSLVYSGFWNENSECADPASLSPFGLMGRDIGILQIMGDNLLLVEMGRCYKSVML